MVEADRADGVGGALSLHWSSVHSHVRLLAEYATHVRRDAVYYCLLICVPDGKVARHEVAAVDVEGSGAVVEGSRYGRIGGR